MKNFFAVIPAINPDEQLLDVVKGLADLEEVCIIIVNDGSCEQYIERFIQAEKWAVVLTHEQNLGKGAALKTAFDFINKNCDGPGIAVTADADGQHRIADIRRVLLRADNLTNSSGLVLGVRTFKNSVPFRSRFGNRITRAVFYLLTGISVRDTQTGLRAFRLEMLPVLLKIKGERYEYEMNVLLFWAKHGFPITEVPIETVYQSGNPSSHFRAIRDSMKIYGSIVLFLISSFLCFVLDYSLFAGFFILFAKASRPWRLVACSAAARMISGTVNFCLNRTCVFRHNQSVGMAAIQYGILALGILCANTGILFFLVQICGINALAAKLLTECALWVVSFFVQQCLIFSNK